MAKYDQFEGFQVDSADAYTVFTKRKFDTKPFGDNDVEIKIECCGVCSSDIHTINGGWGRNNFPLTVGHGKHRYYKISIAVFRQVQLAAN